MSDELIAVIATTVHKGMFFGYIKAKDIGKETISLKNARMAIRWGTENGFMQLCKTGPTERSKISDECNIPFLPNITGIFEVTEEAEKQWKKLKQS